MLPLPAASRLGMVGASVVGTAVDGGADVVGASAHANGEPVGAVDRYPGAHVHVLGPPHT